MERTIEKFSISKGSRSSTYYIKPLRKWILRKSAWAKSAERHREILKSQLATQCTTWNGLVQTFEKDYREFLEEQEFSVLYLLY